MVLFSSPRKDGSSLRITWCATPTWTHVEVSTGKKDSDGALRPLSRPIRISMSELFDFSDGIARACKLAASVRR